MKIAYLFTTFPVLSETFLQREVRILLKKADALKLYSIWKGEDQWEGQPVQRFHLSELSRLLVELPRWVWKKPQVLHTILQKVLEKNIPNCKNLAETFLGLGFGIIQARTFEKEEPDLIHAAWATMPATAAWVIHQLTGLPYSTGAHAYDVFEDGGDCLLVEKLNQAQLIHTSTQATQAHLARIIQEPAKIKLIRRGMNHFPDFNTNTDTRPCLKLISVGRLVEKKGYFHQLEIYHQLQTEGIPFQARIIGAGPLEAGIRQKIQLLGLEASVELLGKIDSSQMFEHYAWSHALLFTGIIAANGDRDGLPNVIPEAMAAGVLVLTSPVSGTTEAITNNETGFVISLDTKPQWVNQLQAIYKSMATFDKIRSNARDWVEENFNAEKNSSRLYQEMQKL